MQSYLDMLRQIRDHGTAKHPTRAESGATVNPTIGIPSVHFTHDLADGFPLLTTRPMAWRNIVGELRSFLEGRTTQAEFEANGCKVFWKAWSNNLHDRGIVNPDTGEVFKPGDLGRIYGYQWVANGQLHHVLNCLLNRPTDRRMVVSAWRPDEHHLMALHPCHYEWCVTPYDGKLNLSWKQRSCDFPKGVPANIASYALLAHILAAWAGLEPGKIDCIFCDSHIYQNQLDGVAEWLDRTPGSLPRVEIEFRQPVPDVKLGGQFMDTLYSWDVKLIGYEPQTPQINFGDTEV